MRIKKSFLIAFTMCYSIFYGQLGINTNTPNATLDIQGNMGVRGLIYLGGNDSVTGLLGDVGTVLVSQGIGNPPVWKMIRRPNFDPLSYTVFNNAASQTELGLILNSTVGGNQIHVQNTTLAAYGGSTITQLQKDFQIDNAQNVAIFTFEAIAQLQSTVTNEAADFSCGIFVDDQLKAMRLYTLNKTSAGPYPFYTFDIIGSAQNLSIGNHTAKVACKRRANIGGFSGNLGIGRSVGPNLNNFMTKSSLIVETFEKPDMSNPEPVYNP